MENFTEFILAASAFLLASAVFRSGSPKKVQSVQSDNVITVTLQLFFHAIHEFVIENCQGMNDEHYVSEEIMSELDHEYPESEVSFGSITVSNEEDHFTYAGSSLGDELESEYDELDHMFEVDRERAASEEESLKSTASDHFSYAASGIDDDSDCNEFDHFEYDGAQQNEEGKMSESPRSTVNDHFSYAASAVEDSRQTNEFDHFEYTKKPKPVARKGVTPRPVGTANDHFSYAGSAVEEKFEPSQYDHFEYEVRTSRPSPSSNMRNIYSTSRNHFSYSGSYYEPHQQNNIQHTSHACSVY